MKAETWIEKAERLRVALDQLDAVPVLEQEEAAARESITIAVWLRNEFGVDEEPTP